MSLIVLPVGSNCTLSPVQSMAHTKAKYFDLFVIFYLE